MQRTGSNWSPLATGQIMQPLSGCMSPQPDLISRYRYQQSVSFLDRVVPIIVQTNFHRVFNSRSFECLPLKRRILSMKEKKGGENWGGKSWRWRRLANSIYSTKARKERRIFARRRIRWDISSVNEREGKASFIELRTFNIEPALPFIFGRHASGNRRKIHSASGSWFLVKK